MLIFIPLFIILPGMIYGLNYSSLSWINGLIMVLFTYVNMFYYRSVTKGIRSIVFTFLSIAFSLIAIIILGINHSWLLAFNLLLYVGLTHTQALFEAYQVSKLHTVLLLLFNTFVLNIASFYITAHFVPFTIVIAVAPIIIPVLMYQEYVYFNQERALANLLIFAGVIVGAIIMFFAVKWWALLFILVIPLTRYLSKLTQINFIHSFVFWQLFIHLILVGIY